MADLKISQLTAITTLTPATDVLPVVDVGGVTKKITTNQILGSGGTATLASATITGALAANADTTLGTASKSTNTNLNFSCDLGTQRIYIDRGTRSLVFQDVTSSIENYRIAGITGVHTWSVAGTTAMTLNSTGLGVKGTIGTASGDAVIAFGTRGIIVGNAGSAIASASYLDVAVITNGAGYQGFLSVANSSDGSANTRTQTTFSVFGRGTSSTITQIATADGSAAGASFTVTTPSNGLIRITNTSGVPTTIAAQFFGASSL